MKQFFLRNAFTPPLRNKERIVNGMVVLVFSRKNDCLKSDHPENTRDICNVDQFSGQPFMLNSSGFIMNDIMLFEEAQSDSVARSVLQRIQAIKPESLGDEEFSVEEAFDRMCPPNFGSPAEYLAYQKKLASLDYDRLQALKAEREENSKKIDFTKTD